MPFIVESNKIEDYLTNLDNLVDYEHPNIQVKINEIEQEAKSVEEKAKVAFQFVRDQIQHSFDTNSKVITISASEAISKQEGICFAKSHLLAALLRGMGIPTGFCYQRVTRKGTPESGYALHGLNAIYLPDRKIWFRVDPRGNKEGVHSEFSIEVEKLAYPIRKELDESDYPHIFARPLEKVVNAMRESKNCHELFFQRPDKI